MQKQVPKEKLKARTLFHRDLFPNLTCSFQKYLTNSIDSEISIKRFQGTSDAVGIQFFLKNIHPNMRRAALNLFGDPYMMSSRPNVFGELMRVLAAPSDSIREAVNWVLNGVDPDVALHMRMLSNRYKKV